MALSKNAKTPCDKLRVGVTILLLLTLSACSGGGGPTMAQAPAPTKAGDPVPVTVAPVIFRPSAQVLKFVGTLFGNEEVTISSQVEGKIENIRADMGDVVESGQVLVEIEDDNFKAKLRELEATLTKARADEARG